MTSQPLPGESRRGAAPGSALKVAMAVVATAAVATGYEAYTEQAAGFALLAVAGFYVATLGTVMAYGVWTAAELGMPSLLLLLPIAATRRAWLLLGWGAGIGLLLAVGSVLLATVIGGEASLQPWYWRRIQTTAGTALFAVRGALLEEAFFRLLLIPLLASLAFRARMPRYRVRLHQGRASIRRDVREPAPWMVPAAVVLSSILFGLAHPGNPLAAMLLSPLLALAYLRGGWESAALAHFLANWLVFTFYF